MSVDSKVVAVFGATSEIASAVARRYAEAGHRLVLVGRDDPALTTMTADLAVRGAPDTAVLVADFADTAAIPATAQAAFARWGVVDIALIAYGTLPDQDETERDVAAAQAGILLNFTSPVLLANELARHFASQGHGALAVISSVAGDRGRGSNHLYGAAKGGLQRYLEGMRHRLNRSGVAVLDIRPGFVSTKMTAHLDRKGPLWATPDQVAADIVRAIARRRAVLYTPWFWRGIMLVVRSIPRPLFHRTKL